MNLRDLHYIVTVAETQHFGHAAEKCFVSQPTLSGQIKKVEQELGISLFERSKRSVQTTPIGKLIVKQAQQVLEQANVISQLALNHQDELTGPLRMGVIPTLSPYLLPLILKPLHQQFPQMKPILSEEITDILLERLSNHEIDAALLASDVDSPEYESIKLFDENFWLVHHISHPFSDKDKIQLSDLNGDELLLLSDGHCFSQQIMQACQLKKRSKESDWADLRATSLDTLLQMVAVGFGYTLLPELALKHSSTQDSQLVIRPLKIADTYRTISLVFRKSFPRRKALNAFAELIMNNLPDNMK